MLSCSQMASFYTANVCVIIRGMKTESMPAAAIELKFGSGPYEGWFLKGVLYYLFRNKPTAARARIVENLASRYSLAYRFCLLCVCICHTLDPQT